MNKTLFHMVEAEEKKGIAKWGHADKTPIDLLAAIQEETGEVAHAINHEEGPEKTIQEIAEAIGVLSRLCDMVLYNSTHIKR